MTFASLAINDTFVYPVVDPQGSIQWYPVKKVSTTIGQYLGPASYKGFQQAFSPDTGVLKTLG